MNVVEKEKVICALCHGKGGFKKAKKDHLDSNWIDCGYCEGYGFVEETTTEVEEEEFLTYNKYKNTLTLQLCKLGEIKIIETNDLGKDLYIKIMPHKRNHWVGLIKYLLKFAYYSERVNILPKQAFHFDGEHNFIHWELYITTQELSDFDGILEVIRLYNETVEEDE
jgi:hypothetical protein